MSTQQLLQFVQKFVQKPRNTVIALATLWWLYKVWVARRKLVCRGRAVLITGCDTGFGRLAAKKFDDLGFRVFANCLTAEAAETLRRETSPRLKTLVFDVTDAEKVNEAEKVVLSDCPEGLWGLINNAGIAAGTMTEFTPLSVYRKVMEVNFFAPLAISKQFAPLIKLAKGRIVNVTSCCGRTSIPGVSAYTGSKYALEGYSDALRQELAAFGVKVSIIEPGFMNTNIIQAGFQSAQHLLNNNRTLFNEYKAVYGPSFGEGKMGKIKAADPMLVVDAMVDALTKVEPRHRYIVGPDAKIFFIPLSFIASTWSDAIYKKIIFEGRSKKK